MALNASTITSVIMPTACLKTSRPSIRRWPTVWVEDGPPSTYSFDLCRPSERRCVVNTPRSDGLPGCSCASSTTAPAPSPNSTQVPRSFQSRIRENVSAPITSARLKAPRRRKLSAVASAKTKPEQTACRSKAAPWWMPSAFCTATAVAGKVLSGVEVAQHDQIDRLGVDAGIGQRRPRRIDRQMRGELALRGDMALRGCRCAARSIRRTYRSRAASSALVSTCCGR